MTNREQTEAFLTDFELLSSFGATPAGGVDRQAGSDADAAQRAWLMGWLTERGFSVRIDAIGNIFGLLEFVPGAPYVLAGSHLDSQPRGGRFDGAYGVLAAAHAVWAVGEAVQRGDVMPQFNLGIVDWFNEEGSRFQPSMMGSAVLTGKFVLEDAYSARDRNGVDVKAALEAMGSLGTDSGPEIVSYAEIHVEQGRVLESQGKTIGLVDATWAARKYRVFIEGAQSHTGSTPMDDRRDALLGAALVIVEARKIADRFSHVPLHTSVSELDTEPNSPVVIARDTRFLVDLRAPDEAELDKAAAELEEYFAAAAAAAAVDVHWNLEHQWGVLAYHPEGVELAERHVKNLGLSYRTIMTLAGHDSTNMKDVVPTIMLFVPSVDGIAHNEGELTLESDMVAGLSVLTSVLEQLAISGPPAVNSSSGVEGERP